MLLQRSKTLIMWKSLLLAVVLVAISGHLSDGLSLRPVIRPIYHPIAIPKCNQQNMCSLQPVHGTCKAYIPRYYYNVNRKKCEMFVYGGCGGNGNNFKTLSQCQRKCKRSTGTTNRKCSVKGQVYSTCASSCRRTCNNLGVFCGTACRPGCKCPGGQVIDTRRNRCVPIKSCPSKKKPGSCPSYHWPFWRRRWRTQSVVKAQLSCLPPRILCRNDSQCSGRKKCCKTVCGSMTCQNPA